MTTDLGKKLDSLLELQSLDRIHRAGFALRGVNDPESVSEHSWHLAFLVWLLAAEVPNADPAKALEMALIHDLAEVRLGDLPLTASRYFPPGAKHDAENAAVADLSGALGTRVRELFQEYQAMRSVEARLVKACDKLQLMLKVAAYETWQTGDLTEFWSNPDNFPSLGFAPVDELTSELKRRFTSD